MSECILYRMTPGGNGEIFGERKHDELNARVPVAERGRIGILECLG